MTQAKSSHGGWREEETAILFDAVESAQREGRSLRDAFGDVGRQLGRKPNSIRNYYYAQARALPDLHPRKAPFQTFTQEELDWLLREVLLARAEGESVRACVARLSGGDRQRMLRYQNKYRSVLKNRPELIEAAAEKLRAEGRSVSAPVRAPEESGAYHEALEMSLMTGDRTLQLMLGSLNQLLRRAITAERRVGALPELQAMEKKWSEARRDADRLRVQVDLLKLELEKAGGPVSE